MTQTFLPTKRDLIDSIIYSLLQRLQRPVCCMKLRVINPQNFDGIAFTE